MNKFLLALGVSTLLAAPAAAGRLDVDPTVLQPLSITQAREGTALDRTPDVDYSATRSIQPVAPVESQRSGSVAGSRLDDSLQRGNQGAFFGANGR